MINWDVLKSEQISNWRHILGNYPTADSYFLQEYHQAYELNGDGVARAFVARSGDSILFYPFLVRPIIMEHSGIGDSQYYDIETVYGYTGPLCNVNDSWFLSQAWTAFNGWCLEEKIIAEFVRFNPFISNQQYMDDSCEVQLERETVAISLDYPSEDLLWKSYVRNHRTEVRKALKEGLVCEEVEPLTELGAFKAIYRQTMDRRDAGGYYYFSDEYFDYLCSTLKDNIRLFFVKDGESLVAGVMFLAFGNILHAHLGGSYARYKGKGANNLLYNVAAEWGRGQGMRWLHLGGGLTSNPDDLLLRFKSGISRSRFPFYIGKRIHNQKAYDTICGDWMISKGVQERPNYFLFYRLG